MKSTVEQLPYSPAPLKSSDRGGKYLCFRLGKEDFAIHVARVREIMPMQSLAVVPRMPAHIKGIMNLRGKLIPVIDLRLRLGAPDVEPTPRTSIVVIQIENGGGRAQVGVIVDSVSEVLTLKGADIDDPSVEGGGAAAYLIGVAKVRGKPKFLLDSNLVLTDDEVLSLEGVGARN